MIISDDIGWFTQADPGKEEEEKKHNTNNNRPNAAPQKPSLYQVSSQRSNPTTLSAAVTTVWRCVAYQRAAGAPLAMQGINGSIYKRWEMALGNGACLASPAHDVFSVGQNTRGMSFGSFMICCGLCRKMTKLGSE